MYKGSDSLRSNWLRLIHLVSAAMLLFLGISHVQIVSAQEVPPGFQLITEQPGVALYRKNYDGGTPDYVQVIDLSLGASLNLLYGEPAAMNNAHNRGMFGGPNPSFRQQSIGTFWDQYASTQANPFCVTNGQFFYMPESPTPLALPLLVDHLLLAEGFGYPQYPEKQLMLALWSDHADILPLTPENLQTTKAPSIIGGLTEEANKKPKNAVGRTFVGIFDRDGDQRFETIAIYTTQTATQPEAARTIRSFGAVKVMMLDGGGSTQLICQGRTYIDTTRAIPQALGVSAGPKVTAALTGQEPHIQETLQSEEALSLEPAATARGTEQSLTAEPQSSATQPHEESALTFSAPEEQIAQPVETGAAAQPPSLEEPNTPQTEPAQNDALLPTNPSANPLAPLVDPQQALNTESSARVAESEPSTNPGSAHLTSSSIQGPRIIRANGLDILVLPAIISPLSLILFYLARRQIFLLYRR